jgi:hypothetical protein
MDHRADDRRDYSWKVDSSAHRIRKCKRRAKKQNQRLEMRNNSLIFME